MNGGLVIFGVNLLLLRDKEGAFDAEKGIKQARHFQRSVLCTPRTLCIRVLTNQRSGTIAFRWRILGSNKVVPVEGRPNSAFGEGFSACFPKSVVSCNKMCVLHTGFQ